MGAVVATVFASAHADCDNGIAALHESSRPGWHDRRATHRIAVRGLEEAQAILNRPGRLTRGSPHLRTVARVSEAPPKLGLQGLVALIFIDSCTAFPGELNSYAEKPLRISLKTSVTSSSPM